MAITPIFHVVEELKRGLQNLSVADLKQELADRTDLLLVDIRELQETVDLGTIPGAVHVPRGMLEFWADPASPYYRDYFAENKRIVVFCAGGGRSAFAAKALLDIGFEHVAHLEAGFNGWARAGEAVQDVAASSRWMRKPATDPRPPLWIGHALLAVPDVVASKTFFLTLGMRHVETTPTVAVLELRGGTHLVLVPADRPVAAGARAPFDLMVEDLDATHAALTEAGIAPTPIEPGQIHRSFAITEPGGHRITVNSTHATGLPV